MIEHALCPLDARESLRKGMIYETEYSYTDANRNRKVARVQIGTVEGLSASDELFLWGILGLALSGKEPSNDFYATPYWILKQLGRITPTKKGSEEFRLFRESIRRLAGVRYHNSAFYDPIRGEHREVSFGLLNYSLPLNDKSARAWRFAFDPIFWELVSANRSSLRFDMAIYSALSPAARRMYLFLKKQFWRRPETGSLDMMSTALSVLGFHRTMKAPEVRRKLERVIAELMETEIVTLSLTQGSVKDCFEKIGVGEYHFTLNRGVAFDKAGELGSNRPEDSPHFDSLVKIGFDRPTIIRLLDNNKPSLLAQWIDITLAAMERGVIDKTPAAYFMYYVQRKATPPDWWHELKRVERQQEADQQRARSSVGMKFAEERDFDSYLRNEVKNAFETVMQNLTEDLMKGGKTRHEAESTAREHALQHFRNRFRREKNPSFERL